MKRIFSLLLLLTFAFGAFADHMNFMGIPINGTLSQFCAKLVNQKGCSYERRQESDGFYELSGKFAGCNNCEFYVFNNENTKQVYHIDVYLPKCNTWSGIKNQYLRVVRDYNNNPDFELHEQTSDFESPYYEGCGNEVEAVQNEKIDYSTVFYNGSSGLLLVKISKFMQVKISYYDVANYPDDDEDDNNSTVNNNNNSRSLLFWGLPMRGSIKSFAQQLVNQKNCTIEKNYDHCVELSGTFTGKQCEVWVYGTPSSNTVWKVCVYLPTCNTWTAIKNQFYSYKSKFDAKYSLTSNYHYFDDPYEEGDGYEVTAIKDEKCHFSAYYDAPNGSISVRISKYMQVELTYEDSTNSDLYDTEEGSSNDDDI